MAIEEQPVSLSTPENGDTDLPSGPPKAASGRNLLTMLVKLSVAGLIIYWLYRRGDVRPERMKQALERWPMFLGVCGITLFAYWSQGFRWLVLLRSRDIKVPLWNAFFYLMEGKFLNLIVPAYVGEDFMRGLYAVRTHEGSRSRVIASLLVDRASGVFTMLLFGAVGLLLRPALLSDIRLRGLLLLCLGAIVATLAGVLVLRFVTRPPHFVLSLAKRLHLHVAIDAMYAEGHHYAQRIPLLLWAVFLTIINQSFMILSFYLLGQTLGMTNVTMLDFAIYSPCGMLATMLPVAPMGLGVGQLAFLSLFRLAHSEGGADLYSLYTLMVLLMSLLGGIFYVTSKSKSK